MFDAQFESITSEFKLVPLKQ